MEKLFKTTDDKKSRYIVINRVNGESFNIEEFPPTDEGVEEIISILDKELPLGADSGRQMRKRIAQAITTLLHQQAKERWISVEDRLPESGKCVMLYSENSGVVEGAYGSEKNHFLQWRWYGIMKEVTYWAPLPAKPE